MSSDSITDPFLEALDARIFGASHFDSGVKILDDILNLQFRLYYNIATNPHNTTANNNKLDILLKECEIIQVRCDQSIQLSSFADNKYYLNLILNILQNCKAIVQFYRGDKASARKTLNKTHFEYALKHDFELLLQLEKFYYNLQLSESQDVESVLKQLSIIMKDIPLNILSKGYIFDYLHSISSLLKLNINTLERIRAPLKLHAFFLFILKEDIDNGELLKFNKMLIEYTTSKNIADIKFPKANQLNSIILEQFHIILQLNLQKLSTLSQLSSKVVHPWKSFIISSMGRTFQSHIVSKSSMIFFHLIDENLESVLNFKNIIKYTHQLIQLNKFQDRISLIDSYNWALSMDINDKSHGMEKSDIIKELLKLLTSFYQDYNVKLFNNNKESLNFISNNIKTILPNMITHVFIKSWSIIYELNNQKVDMLQSNQLTSYLCNAMSLSPKDQDVLLQLYYKYAYTLTVKRQIDTAISFLQSFILKDNPFFYKAWHLLALCKSIKEDKQDSYKIICSVLESLQNDEEAQEEVPFKTDIKWDKNKAWETVNFKLTELYLLDEIFGTREAVEVLPDLFEMYHNVYDGNVDSTDLATIKKQNTQLQQIWLLTAELYMKLHEEENQLTTDDSASDWLRQAREAIAEAKGLNPGITNINCYILEGYYFILERNPTMALNEFEKALYYDKNNADAVVGYSHLIFSYEEEDTCLERFLPLIEIQDAKPLDSTLPPLFINKTDKLAALASVKLLLERSIINSIEAFYSADVWWYLSLIYEKYQEKEYQDALLTCIRNKETTPIRPFKFL
ncbi:cargo-transport protein Ypp1p [Monosporozyma unispora]|nr:Cargo-transport protein ypp1 [Kazachstania unispora]